MIAPDSLAARALISKLHEKLTSVELLCLILSGRSAAEGAGTYLGGYSATGPVGEFVASLTEYCKYRAKIRISVEALTSGYSLMADGIIRVAENLATFAYVYKASDGTGAIKCHALL